MVFNSIEFIFYFIPIFFLIYYFCPLKGRNFVLLAGSFVFYAIGDVYTLPIVVLSAFLNYSFGNLIEHRENNRIMRKVWLVVAVLSHVGMFFLFRMTRVLPVIPLGLSFYTFRAISYVIDVYCGKIHAEVSPMRYFTYFFMFPQFVSGPITRYREVKSYMERRKVSLLQVMFIQVQATISHHV